MAEAWSPLEILGKPGQHPDPLTWERECPERALAAAGTARAFVIGKSLTSLLAGGAATATFPAWL